MKGSLLSLLAVLHKKGARWAARWRAKTATNFRLRLAMLFGFGVLITLFGAALYQLSNPEEEWSSSLFTVYAVLWSIPGADITNHPSPLATFVLNLIFIFGLLVFATILAMLTDEINNVLMAARSGRTAVALSGHILLLNWNQQVPFILDQLEQVRLRGGSHPFHNRPLVILADMDKEELDSLVVGLLKHSHLEVHTRSGKPYKLEHLVRVAAADAFAVLLMHPETGGGDDGEGGGGEGGEDGDVSEDAAAARAAPQTDAGGAAALKLQTVMALTSLKAGKKVALVVQAPDDSNVGLQELDQVLMRAGHPTNLINLPVKTMVNSLAVQTTLQPWRASIYHSILQQGLQPCLTFTRVPETLFVLKSGQAGILHPHSRKATSSSASLSLQANPPGGGFGGKAPGSPPVLDWEDCTVSFEEARVAVVGHMLTIGYISKTDGQLYLNPPETNRLSKGDVLVALTTRDKVATSGVKMPLSARAQAALMKAGMALHNSPALSWVGDMLQKRPAAAAEAPAPAAAAAQAGSSAAGSSGSGSGSSGSSSSGSRTVRTGLAAPAAAPAGVKSSLGSIHETAEDTQAASAAAGSSAAAAKQAGTTGSPEIAAATSAAEHARKEPVGAALGADAGTSNTAAAGAPVAGPSGAAAPRGGSAGSAAAPAAAAAATAAAAAAAAAAHSSSRQSAGSTAAAEVDDADKAAAADDTATAKPAAAADAPAQDKKPAGTGTEDKQQQQQKSSKKKQSSWFACCFAPSVEDDDAVEEQEGAGRKKGPGSLEATGKSTSFKLANVGKTVTGAVTTVGKGVGKGVTTVGKGVTTVGKGVTSAVTTVADGAAKTIVTSATALGDVVATVADGAVDITKTVAIGAVATVAGGAGLVANTVASAVSAPVNLLTKSDTFIRSSSASTSSTTTPAPAASTPGLFAAPAGWLFGGGKKQQSEHKAAAQGRVANVDVEVARASAPPLKVVVAGFTSAEGAYELLPHFLDFAPENSTVIFVVKEPSPPEGFESQGTVASEEEREGAPPLHHCVHYRFVTAANPTSGAALCEAGLLTADAVLLAAEEGLRASPAEADAAVLSSLVSIQHLLASRAPVRAPSSHSRSTGTQGVAAKAASLASKAASGAAGSAFGGGGDALSAQAGGGSSSSGPAQHKVPHVVACVSSTSSKAVAAAFFGAPAAGEQFDLGAAVAAAAGMPEAANIEARAGGVVGARLFTYELLVPGEIEGSVLVQVAIEPMYVKVVQEMLCTSEGCELYLLPPAAFGFTVGEELAFAEVQECGRLLRRTAIGVVSDGRIELVPGNTWRWNVKANDKIAAIADAW